MNCWKMKSGTGFRDRQEIREFVKAFKENNPVTCAIFCHTLQYDSVEALVAMVRTVRLVIHVGFIRISSKLKRRSSFNFIKLVQIQTTPQLTFYFTRIFVTT